MALSNLRTRKDLCDAKGNTVYEKLVNTYSQLLGPSCSAGSWVEDPVYDETLKERYSKLLQLCYSDTYMNNIDDSFQQSLNCLVRGIGDVALTNFRTVQNLINSGNDTNKFRYLCPTDETASLNGDGCSWINQWNLLVANNDTSLSDLSEELKVWFKSYLKIFDQGNLHSKSNNLGLTQDTANDLKKVLFPSKSKIDVISNTPLLSYLQDIRKIPSYREAQICDLQITWCTISNEEQEKCEWFTQAALNYEIQPVMKCFQRTNKSECIEAVIAKEVDLVTIDTKIFPGKMKDLTALKYAISGHQLSYLIVVKSDLELNDKTALNNKRGCYGNIGHRNSTTELTTNAEALNCFHKTGDFAVLSYTDDLQLNETYTLWCDNSSKIQFSDDKPCVWKIPMSVVVSRTGHPLQADIELFLSEAESWFVKRNVSAFRLFERFKDNEDLLFHDTTEGLYSPNSMHQSVQTYNRLLRFLVNNGIMVRTVLTMLLCGVILTGVIM